MNITYIYLAIISMTITIYQLTRNIIKTLKISGIISIISSFLTVIIGFIIKLVINKSISFINLSNATTALSRKFTINGLLLLAIGIIELTIVYIINYLRQEKTAS